MSNLRGSKLKKKKREKIKKKRISHLPDDLWRKILDLGIKNSKYTYKDLCSISITCKRLHRLSSEDSLWSLLLSSDFSNRYCPFLSPCRSSFYVKSLCFDNYSSSSAAKSCYKIKIEKNRERERDQERRWFLFRSFTFKIDDLVRKIEEHIRAENETIAAVLSKIQEIELTEQNEKRKPTVAEYFKLPKAKCNGYERVPDRRCTREKRSKGFTRQRKCWYQ